MHDFILQHRNDDPRDLALHASRYKDIDIPYAVQQIAAWQTAKRKLPLWAETDGIEYPVHLSMEQCSSQITAEYKAQVAAALPIDHTSMTDLTSGFGVDATMIGRQFKHLNYVERNEELCRIASHNLPLLGISSLQVHNADAANILPSLPHQSLIFLDPARRDENGGKTVQISDCTPDVTLMQDELLSHADRVMIKLSPMLDIANILKDLHNVQEIHIVSVAGECKEMLVVLGQDATPQHLPIYCVNLKSQDKTESFAFFSDEERTAECHYADAEQLRQAQGYYLYEPNASIMKAGCFKSIAMRYGVCKLHPSSHLYVSAERIDDFPGRTFCIEAIHGIKDKALKSIKKANLTVRNFPATVAELRKRMKLSEGGNDYLFATTLSDDSKTVIKCKKKSISSSSRTCE